MSDTAFRANVTADQLLALPRDGRRRELVRGVLRVMSPAGGRHGRIAGKLLARLLVFVERHRLGHVFAAETGFLLETDPDTVRAPDVAFVSTEALGELVDYPGYLPVVPELVAEVLSPTDRPAEVEEKTNAWLRAGVRIVLIVDPRAGTVSRHMAGQDARIQDSGSLDLGAAIPGCELDVGELFA